MSKLAVSLDKIMPPDSEEPKSKSQIKREIAALKELGKQLVALSRKNLIEMPLPENLMNAILAAKTFKREVLRRQLQHIAGLLGRENVDVEEIYRALHELSLPHKKEVQAMHDVERWRDSLIAGDDVLINDLVSRYASADRQQLRQLVRNARREQQKNNPPKSSRVLYQYLMGLLSGN